MTERLTFQDLDRDELLALLNRRLLLCSQADLLWAKWEVTSERSINTFQAYIAASEQSDVAFKFHLAKRCSKSLAAHEAAAAKEKRLKTQAERLRRLPDDLYERHRKATEARS